MPASSFYSRFATVRQVTSFCNRNLTRKKPHLPAGLSQAENRRSFAQSFVLEAWDPFPSPDPWLGPPAVWLWLPDD